MQTMNDKKVSWNQAKLFWWQIFGDGCVAQSKLTGGANGDFFSINWGWAVGVMMGILVAGGVSGMNKLVVTINDLN